MSELGTQLREHYEQISPPLDTERLTEQFIGADRYRQRRRPVMAMAAAVLITVLVIGTVGVMVLNGDSGPDVIETPQPSPPTTLLPAPESQNPIPDVIVPRQSPSVNQGAVFDTRTGRIIYVDGEGATWTFDVATNLWEQAQPPIPRFHEYAAGDLVYDVDSDRTIGINSGINIFDAASGSWTTDSSSGYPRGAVYDPASGLVVVAFHDGRTPDIVVLRGYDVETGEWSELGTVEDVWGGGWMFLVGYSLETDELILHGGYAPDPGDPLDTNYSGSGPTTVLHNLLDETTTVLRGGPNLFSAWGVWYPYATGVDGAVLPKDNLNEVDGLCQFNAPARTWDCSLKAADWPRRPLEAGNMVYDPINDRLIVIYSGVSVWAIDLDTGRWTELNGTY